MRARAADLVEDPQRHLEEGLSPSCYLGHLRATLGFRSFLALLVAVATAAVALASPVSAVAAKAKPTPMIFVHGNSGSVQQFETNAMRLTSNGFPQDRIFAYEYNTSGSSNDVAIAELDGFIDGVKDETGAAQVDILAHSRGTTVMHAYLSTPERAASVRSYVNFDGRTADSEPGGVPTLAIWGEGDQTREIGGAENVYFPGRAHTEVTTSRRAFLQVYEFLLGEEPETGNVDRGEPQAGQGCRSARRRSRPTSETRVPCSTSTRSGRPPGAARRVSRSTRRRWAPTAHSARSRSTVACTTSSR